MLLSFNTGVICEAGYSLEEAIVMIKQAGFDAVDFSFWNYKKDLNSDEAKKDFLGFKKISDENGIVFNQAHAPFPSRVVDDNESEKIFKKIVGAIKCASYLGVKNIVVHPIQHLKYAQEGNPEKLFEMNMEFYKALEPYCKEYNINVALENMWQGNGNAPITKFFPSTCGRPKEFVRYLDALNSKYLVACLDIGHALLVSEDPYDFIKELGHDRLKALHVHDVDGIFDSHTLPYYGIGKWDRVAKALKEINYDGDFTFEAGCFLKEVPKQLYADGLTYMERVGRYIMSMIK